MTTVNNVKKNGSSNKDGNTAAHNVALAGVGACKEGQELATDQVDKLVESGSSIFSELVARGETVESDFKKTVLDSSVIQKPLNRIKSFLGNKAEVRDKKVKQLSAKVDNLVEAVAKLAEKKVQEQEEKERLERQKRGSANKSATTTASKSATVAAAKTAPSTAKGTNGDTKPATKSRTTK